MRARTEQVTTGAELLAAAWAPLLALADGIDDDRGWTPTHLPGWVVRDLLFHLSGDAQRALVALFTPAPDPDDSADTDEVDYWRVWTPGTDSARTGLRSTRAIASQWSSVRGPAQEFAETARAATRAAGAADPEARVLTQGRTLTVDALLRTLAVEAAVHHLDLEPVQPDPPAQSCSAKSAGRSTHCWVNRRPTRGTTSAGSDWAPAGSHLTRWRPGNSATSPGACPCSAEGR